MCREKISILIDTKITIYTFVTGREVDKWFLMSSPMPVISIVALYLLLVIKIGPEFMKDRKPLNIKPLILVYNLYQTISNLLIVIKVRISRSI